MTKRVVLFFKNDRVLCLCDVKYDTDGSIKRGYVLNGNWTYVKKNNECQSKNGRTIVHRWQYVEPVKSVEIPPHIKGDYLKLIDWAEDQK